MDLAQRQPQPDHRRGTAARARRLALAVTVALAALTAASGCQSSGGGLLSLWRMGSDSSLSKGPTKEEINDNRNLMARWLTPKKNPHSDPDAVTPRSPLILGSDGYTPIQPP